VHGDRVSYKNYFLLTLLRYLKAVEPKHVIKTFSVCIYSISGAEIGRGIAQTVQ
jgi:hypothetical protein